MMTNKALFDRDVEMPVEVNVVGAWLKVRGTMTLFPDTEVQGNHG
jgi:hypothetical protein